MLKVYKFTSQMPDFIPIRRNLFPMLAGQFFIVKYSSPQMSKPSIDEMWDFIEKILLPYNDMPDKAKMNDDQIFKLYSMMKEADEMFRMLAQIAILKKAIDDKMN